MTDPKAKLRDELIVESWQQLRASSLGAAELERIVLSLTVHFGESAIPSPASIARTLAEHGVPLRHAEVLRFDATWRTRRLNELFAPGELDFQSIKNAIDSVQRIDDLLAYFNSEGDDVGQSSLRELALGLKAELQATAKAKIKLGTEQEIAVEVVEWLTIWLQTPHIFGDWLEIRRTSESFLEKFGPSTDSAD